jgi:hypothetical protein
MHVSTAAEIAFAAAAVIAAAALVAAIVGRASERTLVAVAWVLAGIAVALWVAFAFDRSGGVAVSAVGGTLAAVAGLVATRVPSLVARSRGIDEQLAAAEARLQAVIDRESVERAKELSRTLARARAESASLLADQERRIAEERRRAAAEHERAASAALATALADTQRQVEARLREWNEDLDRMRHALADHIEQLAARQRQLISDAEMRIASDAERLEAESEQQRAGLVRLRDELARAIQETIASGNAELDTYATERRRALHELNERIRRRERSLAEQIEREETEAARRVNASFADVERRQAERLERILDRTASTYSEAAGQQFTDAIRGAREDAARRLSRELDRAVQAYAREAERVLAEQLAQVGAAGAHRLEKRLGQAAEALDRQRGEAMTSFEQRLLGAEHEFRRRLDTLSADAEAERAVLDARLQELARRIDEATARA